MITKKFTFYFTKPMSVYGELITEDSIIALTFKDALRILRKEYTHARIAKVEECEIELYSKGTPFSALPTEVSYTRYLGYNKFINDLEDGSIDNP